MSVTFNFIDKNVIITGAAGKVGLWIAKAFLEEGANLWLVDIDKEKLESIAREFNMLNKVNISTVDLESEIEMDLFFKEVEKKWSHADILVNNAGIYPGSKMLDLELASWDKVMNVNVRAPFLMTKLFSQLLIKQNKPGSVINIISKSAKVPRVGAVHYAVSKASLEMMTRGLGMELAEFNIRVNAVSPGFVPGSDVSFLSEEYINAMNKKIPLGRTSSQKDAPSAVMFLCSEAAQFITGTSLYVDGGNSAGDFSIPVINKN